MRSTATMYLKGRPRPKIMFDELAWWAAALRKARSDSPYPAV